MLKLLSPPILKSRHPGPPTVAEAEEFMRNAEIRLNDLGGEGQPRFLGAVELHHRRHRDHVGRRQRSADRRHHRAGQAGHALRPSQTVRRTRAQNVAAEALGCRSGARAQRSQRAGRAGAHWNLARGRLRQGQILPEERQARRPVSRHWRDRERSWPPAPIPTS